MEKRDDFMWISTLGKANFDIDIEKSKNEHHVEKSIFI